jgi:hypothetical protein
VDVGLLDIWNLSFLIIKELGLDSKQLNQGDIFILDLIPLQNMMTTSRLEMLGRHNKDVKELGHQQELSTNNINNIVKNIKHTHNGMSRTLS